ncbi:phosphonoacetate hydrolase [Isorropodon fossajaponicum endosymbiont JTNG4]|uniref:PhnA domain-containing protein n=1 Tax=Isorropodon fossajaponicum symbiont TaxID=883811 RepID=UPI0019163281|nr:alkylphosphonate utilization protein [Isorropodon fossajaponicum symbiont]BBB23648.1 phosphonoacetate hydrolase [Isorropodon fossajaponicum endosymbiont JTNG4]
MDTEQILLSRSQSKCELCGNEHDLSVFAVMPSDNSDNQSILICNICHNSIDNPKQGNINYWHCLNDSMWSSIAAVQVVAWRILTKLSSEGWPQDLLDMLYLDDETLTWAQAMDERTSDEQTLKHKDSHGTQLDSGDTVILIKDLTVKGANFTAKRGTAVRNISLVTDNAEHIEGKIEGQRIVILTKFV